ncbi:hypothetical protein ACVGWC_11035, partial [Enterobacter hormaechei]
IFLKKKIVKTFLVHGFGGVFFFYNRQGGVLGIWREVCFFRRAGLGLQGHWFFFYSHSIWERAGGRAPGRIVA